MAITLTKKVTSVWADGRPPKSGPGSISDIILPYIETMVAEGKTDGVYYYVDDTTNYRLWTDQTSAQTYSEFCLNTATEVGRTDLTVTVTDI